MAAVDYFLKIEGIAGSSTDRQHKGEIEVDSFSWGVTQVIGSGGSGGTTGRAVFSDFAFTTQQSLASPTLMLKCASGQHLKEAVLTARTLDQRGTPQTFLTLTLTDVLVTAYQEAGASDVPIDNTSLHYAKITEVQAAPQQVGLPPAVSVTLQYDPKTNTVQVIENTSGPFAVGATEGGIARAVQEFDISSVLGLITRPGATAKLRLLVNEVRSPAATIASVPEGSGGRGHAARYDVLLYTPADLEATAEDITRSGRRVGRLWVDPEAAPASLDTDLSHIFQRGSLTSFGIRLQLHDARLVGLHESADGEDEPRVQMNGAGDDQRKSTRAQASATFSIQLVLDTA